MDWMPWIESAGVSALTLGAIGLGRWCSTLPGRSWVLGYVVPLLLIVLIGMGRLIHGLEFLPPFEWLLAGRAEFVLGGLCAACVLSTPCSRLKTPRERRVLMLFVVFFVSVSTVWPFLAPAFNRAFWLRAVTEMDPNGVCLQATDYSCGPAAAVTALRRLGIPAGEGEIAILAHTSNAIGTPSDLLATAIQKRFGPQGVDCRYRSYRSVQELRQGAPAITLAVIRFSLFVDHYVAVLHVDETRVVVGDPAKGLRAYTIGDFERIWKHTGVQIQRGHAPTTSQPGAKSL